MNYTNLKNWLIITNILETRIQEMKGTSVKNTRNSARHVFLLRPRGNNTDRSLYFPNLLYRTFILLLKDTCCPWSFCSETRAIHWKLDPQASPKTCWFISVVSLLRDFCTTPSYKFTGVYKIGVVRKRTTIHNICPEKKNCRKKRFSHVCPCIQIPPEEHAYLTV